MTSQGYRRGIPDLDATEAVGLANGTSVIVRENPVAPVVALSLLVGVGSRDERADTNGVTTLLGRVLMKGTRARSALEVAQVAEDAGGELESGTDQEYSELRAHGLARYWRSLLELVHEVASAPSLAPEEIARERDTLIAQIRALDDQPFPVANRLLSRALYGTHPYGLPTLGDVGAVGRLERADLLAQLEAFQVPSHTVLAVSGDVPRDAVLAEAERLFGAAAPRPAGAPSVPPPGRPAEPRIEERRATQQAHLLLGVLAPPVGHPDHLALKVMNAVLGGGMSSRLFRILRDQRGLAYAVGSFYPTRRDGSRIVIHIGTAPENIPAAEAGIREEMRRLGEEPVPDDEIERTKASLAGAFELDLRTNARRAFYLAMFELLGVGARYLGRHRALIEAVTADEVRRVARRYLVEPSVAVVGPG